MVKIHAPTMFFAVAHFTEAIPFVMPTPIIDPVIVWVVLTGIPVRAVPISVKAPAVSAQKPCTGFNFARPSPRVLITFQPPVLVPNAMTE
ncbi:hypothetical protein SDC9_131073 [bioreactor metagenome]|uniref:Uncharacterized protein n=1 Tax=bioreactor metagenome TaxID=1076179 RepID=A0A645D4N4_9ZZZZ